MLENQTLGQSPVVTPDPKIFSNFRNVAGAEKALDAFKGLANGKADWFMLLCYGTAGCGKTHLCEALAHSLTIEGNFTRVIQWQSFIRNLKMSIGDKERPWLYDEIFRNHCISSRLIFDDVGMGGTGSSWEWGEFEEIICHRYNNYLMTVVTTNLDIKELPDRVVSRFRDRTKARLVYNGAKDYRPEL